MQIKRKTLHAIIIALLAIAIAFTVGGLLSFKTIDANAEAEQDFYYAQLSPEAKRFYDAISDMNEKGLLKQGRARYDLIENNVLNTAQLESYSQSSKVMTDFGAARDAFYLDHPEVFYVDFSYLSINVGTKNGNYVATLGTGRADNYYLQGAYNSEEEVNTAITEFNAKLKQITDKAAAKENVVDKIKSVNADLVNSITYDFCVESEKAAYAPHIRTSYGGIVNGYSVCEGYTRTFKAAMDALEIPCVIIHGYASYTENLEPHTWNAVKVNNVWYGVDVTWNDTTGVSESYLLRGATEMDSEHVQDGVISAVNYKFQYPLLNDTDYENVSKPNGFSVNYVSEQYRITYDGKTASELKKDGLYLAYRGYYVIDGNYQWSSWVLVNAMLISGSFTDAEIAEYEKQRGYSELLVSDGLKYIQFAVINKAPDAQYFGILLAYDNANMTDNDIVGNTAFIENADFSPDQSAPYIKTTAPNTATVNLDPTETYEVTIVYTQALKKTDNNPVTFNVTTYDPSAKDYMEITDVTWNESTPDTITFKFSPSPMYQHRDEAYSFVPVNLVGESSEKLPMEFTYLTRNNNVACNKVYGDGRLYVNTYGAPSLVGSGDLSLNGWKDGNGNPVGENQRSQLMLVATKPSEAVSDKMVEEGLKTSGIDKALSADTFELEMNLCKNIATIPEGSTVQLAFGFPAGYGPDDAGVTFKVYHFKRVNGKIDYSQTVEIPCVITEYGLIVNVTDFSPFAVVAVEKSKVTDLKKSLYVRSVGFGGSFECTAKPAEGESDIARLVGNNESLTYKINTNDGYRVARVTLNGEPITVNENTFTLSYDRLSDSNAVEIHYVADSVAEYEKEQGIEVIYPCLKIAAEPTSAFIGAEDEATGGLSKGAIAAIVIVVILLVAAGAAALIIIQMRKNKAVSTAAAKKSKKTAKPANTSKASKTAKTAKPATKNKNTKK